MPNMHDADTLHASKNQYVLALVPLVFLSLFCYRYHRIIFYCSFRSVCSPARTSPILAFFMDVASSVSEVLFLFLSWRLIFFFVFVSRFGPPLLPFPSSSPFLHFFSPVEHNFMTHHTYITMLPFKHAFSHYIHGFSFPTFFTPLLPLSYGSALPFSSTSDSLVTSIAFPVSPASFICFPLFLRYGFGLSRDI